MKLIVCIDDNGGVAFNHRRQSRDRFLIDDIIEGLRGEKIFIEEYSLPLFEGKTELYSVVSFPPECTVGTFFVERTDPSQLFDESDISEIVLYKWGRVYPSDRYFGMKMKDFTLVEEKSFEGYSHENITREVWKK